MRVRSICVAITLSLGCLQAIPSIAAEAPISTAQAAVDPVHKAVEQANKAYAAAKYDDAAKIYIDALKATEKAVGPMAQLNRAILYSNLGTVYFAQKKFAESEQSYKYALDIQKQLLKGHAAVVADTMQHYSALLRRTGKAAEADRWQTQAEYLLVGNLSGRDRLVEPAQVETPHHAESTFSSPAARVASDVPAGASTTVSNVVAMTTGDKSLLDNPLTVQKPVYRTEEYWEGGGATLGGFGAMMVGGVKKTRQVLDHYESVPVEDAKSSLSYTSAVADFERSYNLSASNVKTICDAINSGGSAMELGNGWLVVTDEPVDLNVWRNGQSVSLSKSPEGSWVVSTKDGKSQVHAKRIAAK
jgi:tetratricopeptide (TPR) repeat protein